MSFIGYIFLFGVLSILLVTVFHALIPHDHPAEIFGEGTQAIFHGESRKLLFILLSFFLVAVWFSARQGLISDITSISHNLARVLIPERCDSLKEAFRTGIIHPQLYN